jgi:hypothetical protein
MERMFALYQCNKVLGFMGLRYEDLYTPGHLRKLYKENTHVFAYYVMTGIFLNDHAGFLLWCHANNTNLLKFQASPAIFTSFGAYIRENYKCISLLNGMGLMGALNTKVNKTKNKVLQTTTRMSVIHI